MTDQENLRVAIATLSAQLPHLARGQDDLKAEIGQLRGEVRDVKGAVDAVPELIETALKNYVRVEDYASVKNIVTGSVNVVLYAFLTAVLGLVLGKASGVL